jgi:hypothetical protein
MTNEERQKQEPRASSELLEASDKLATLYASKELIDRAVDLTGRTLSDNDDSYRYLGNCSLLVKDLAKAASLPEDQRGPSEVETLCKQREEAILRWLREAKVWPQDSSIGQPGYWLGEEHLEQAAILFRGGPANEPRPSSALLEAAKATVEGLGLPEHLRYGEWLTTTLGKLYLAIKAEEARGTEPRASSPLLEAVLNIHKLDSLLNDALNEQVRRAQEGK